MSRPAALAGLCCPSHKPNLCMWGLSSHQRCCQNFITIITKLLMGLLELLWIVSNKNWMLSRGEEK